MPKPDQSSLSALRAAFEGKGLFVRAAKRAAKAVGRGIIIDTRGRRWNPELHPRDSRGRFIETGGVAQVWGGGRGKVVRALGNGRVELRMADGSRRVEKADRLTMVSRPNGGRPVKDNGTRKNRALVLAEDIAREKNPKRGDGVKADDDHDGIPNHLDHTPKGFPKSDKGDWDRDGKDDVEADAPGEQAKRKTVLRDQFSDLKEVQDHWDSLIEKADKDEAAAIKHRRDNIEEASLSPEGEHVVGKLDGKWQVFESDSAKPAAGHSGSATLRDRDAALKRSVELDSAHDHADLGGKQGAARALPKGHRDAGDGYSIVDVKPKDKNGLPQRELYDPEGRLVGSTTTSIDSPAGASRPGWDGNAHGRPIRGHNEAAWVAQAKRADAEHKAKARGPQADDVHDRLGDRFWNQLVERNGGDKQAAAKAAQDHLEKVRKDRQASKVDGVDRVSERIQKHIDDALKANNARKSDDPSKKAPEARDAKPKVNPDGTVEVSKDPKDVADDLRKRNGREPSEQAIRDEQVRRAMLNHPDSVANRKRQMDAERDAAKKDDESRDSRPIQHRKENEASAERGNARREQEIAEHDKAVDAARSDSRPEVQEAVRRYDNANPDNLLAKRGAARDVAKAREKDAGAPQSGRDGGGDSLFDIPESAPGPKRGEASGRRDGDADVRADRGASLEDAPAEGVRPVQPGREEGAVRPARGRGEGVGRDSGEPAEAAGPERDVRAGRGEAPDGPEAGRGRGDQGVPAAAERGGRGDGSGPDRAARGAAEADRGVAPEALDAAEVNEDAFDEAPEEGLVEGLLPPVREKHPDAPKFRPTGQADLADNTNLKRARGNIEALRTLRELEKNPGQPATPEQQRKLAKWAGWGSIAQEMFSENPTHKKTYAAERAALDELGITEEEKNAALRNTMNAHYTDADVVKAMWEGLHELGFGGGQVLEPGSGSGNFMGFAPDNAQMVGVELEPLTAKISHYLYPDATVANMSIADFHVPDGTFDAAIGNVPFATIKPADSRLNPGRRHNLHNYSILKGLEQMRPGGIGMFVTSRYTMDSQDPASRQAMFDRADLIGAIRLPSGAHEKAAGTKVVTDVLVFRKRMPGEEPGSDQWLGTSEWTKGSDGKPLFMNNYFRANPEKILGTPQIGQGGGMHSADDMQVVPNGDHIRGLRAALARMAYDANLDGKRMTERPADAPARPVGEILRGRAGGGLEGSIVHHEGEFKAWRDGELVPVKVAVKDRVKMRRLLEMRDLTRKLLDHQRKTEAGDPKAEKESDRLRAELNKAYDAFVKANKSVEYPNGGAPINDSKWMHSISDSKLDEPVEKSYASLETGDIFEWPEGGVDGRGKVRRAVVTGFDDNNQIKANLIGVAEKDGRGITLSPDDPYSVTVTGKRTMNPYRKRLLPAVFNTDPEMGLVTSLESYDAENNTAKKGRILKERVLAARPELRNVEDPETALSMILDHDGNLTLAKAARVMGVDEPTARERLRGHIFKDPTDGGWVTRDQYLSGNVREKLRAAEAAAEDDPDLRENVEALEKVLPAWLGQDRVKPKMGATWIGEETMQDYVRQLVDDPNATVTFNPVDGWKVEGNRPRTDTLNGGTWGTVNGTYKDDFGNDIPFPGAGRTAYELVEAAMNHTKIKVTYKRGDNTFVDEKGTLAAAAKLDQLKENFAGWLWQDPERRESLLSRYNDEFNSLVRRHYPDAPLHPEGMNERYELYPHQASAIRRMLNEPATLIAHEVGAGKTLEMASAAMELRRRGLAQKPMIVVPNHMKEQWHREFMDAFPQAKVLAIATDDLEGGKRQEFLGKVATGDWDAVIITHSTFGSVSVSRETQRAYIDKQLKEMRDQRAAMIANGVDGDTVKKFEERIAKREEKLKEKLAKNKQDGISFEQLGVDYLMVDEAHEFKNLERNSGMADESIEGSDKATDLHMKVEFLRDTNTSGRYVTFATATPVSNSFGETHTMMNYLRPDLLEEAKIKNFDSFLANFANVAEDIEMSVDGGSFESKQRIRSFTNAPGMFRIWQQVADVQTAEDLDLDVPDVDHGQPEMVMIEPTDWFKNTYKPRLQMRAEAAKAGGRKGKGEDNILVVNNDGKAAALDQRMVGGPPAENGGKIGAAVSKLMEIHEDTKDNVYLDPITGEPMARKGGLQLVFLDMGTPGASRRFDEKMARGEEPVGDSVGFEAYEEIKRQLVEAGMPAEQIAFMHDAKGDNLKKAKLFAKARSGEISVLIGSTALMGVGTNVQDRTTALHHLDVPYRPSDIAQRVGRAVRQKNQNSKVRILQYAVDGSLDSRLWDIQERKGRFIGQLMKGDLNLDEFEELSPTILNASEMKAFTSGNQYLMDHTRTKKALNKLQVQKQDIDTSVRDAKERIDLIDRTTPVLQRHAERLDEISSKLTPKEGGASKYEATVEVAGKPARFAKRADLGDAMRLRAKSILDSNRGMKDSEGELIGSMGGYEVWGRYEWNQTRVQSQLKVWMPDVPESETIVPQDKITTVDLVTRLENIFDGLPAKAKGKRARMVELARDRKNAESMLDREFSPEDNERLEATKSRFQRLNRILQWQAESGNADKEIPDELKHDEPWVDEVLGKIVGKEEAIKARPKPSSLKNIDVDGTVKPRTNSHLRRKQAREVATAKSSKTKAPSGTGAERGDVNPQAGQRVTEPDVRRLDGNVSQVFDTVHGNTPGATRERVLGTVQKSEDGAWEVFRPGHDLPLHRATSRADGEDWARREAVDGLLSGKKDAKPSTPRAERPKKVTLDPEQVRQDTADLGTDGVDAPNVDATPAAKPDVTPEAPAEGSFSDVDPVDLKVGDKIQWPDRPEVVSIVQKEPDVKPDGRVFVTTAPEGGFPTIHEFKPGQKAKLERTPDAPEAAPEKPKDVTPDKTTLIVDPETGDVVDTKPAVDEPTIVESVNEGQLPGQTRLGGESVRSEIGEDFLQPQEMNGPAKPKTPKAPEAPKQDGPSLFDEPDADAPAAPEAPEAPEAPAGGIATIKNAGVRYGTPEIDVEPYETTDRHGNKVEVRSFWANGGLNQAKGWTFKKDGSKKQLVNVDVPIPDHIKTELDRLRVEADREKANAPKSQTKVPGKAFVLDRTYKSKDAAERTAARSAEMTPEEDLNWRVRKDPETGDWQVIRDAYESDRRGVIDLPEPRDGEVGGKYASDEVVRTASGRETTPFPEVDTSTPRKTDATLKRVEEWLMANARDEAAARGIPFYADEKGPWPQADKDMAEHILFDKDWLDMPAKQSILKPLNPADRTDAPEAPKTPDVTPDVTPDAPLGMPEGHKGYKPTKTTLDEVGFAIETAEADHGRGNSGIEIRDGRVHITDPERAIRTLEGPRDVAADNADDEINPFGERSRYRAVRDGLTKLIDAIKQDAVAGGGRDGGDKTPDAPSTPDEPTFNLPGDLPNSAGGLAGRLRIHRNEGNYDGPNRRALDLAADILSKTESGPAWQIGRAHAVNETRTPEDMAALRRLADELDAVKNRSMVPRRYGQRDSDGKISDFLRDVARSYDDSREEPGFVNTRDLTPEEPQRDVTPDVTPAATPDVTPDDAPEQPSTPDDPEELPEPITEVTPEPATPPTRIDGEKYDPTPQQQDVYDASQGGKDVVIEAGAGAGKTSTLEGLARRIAIDEPNEKIIYIAFNKSVQLEAEGRMPSNVEARTGHSIAFQWASKDLQERFKARGLRRPDEIARHLGITKPLSVGDGEKPLSVTEQAQGIVKAIDTFANSADDKISPKHLPEWLSGISDDAKASLMRYAEKGWEDLKDAKGGRMHLTLDHIRKMWALSKPDLTGSNSGLKRRASILFLDEAQDTPPVLAKVVADQKMRKVIVGDGDQAIYGFTGATDYLSKAEADVRLPLTKSFRYGPEVADIGNRFLQVLGSKKRVEGAGGASKIVPDMQDADAILVRSNGGMIGSVLDEQNKGRLVGVPKGTKKDLESLVETARYLKGEGPAPARMHDDLAPYRTWAEVAAEANKEGADPKIRMLFGMVEGQGVDKLDEIVQRTVELGDGGLEGVTFQDMPHGLVARGKTFGVKDDLKAAGFVWREVPGEKIENGPNKGQPFKAWTAVGTPEKREATMTRLREATAGPQPDVVVSTAHKAKGLEWDRVKIGDDFQVPKTDPKSGMLIMPDADENRLAYVAVTRAQKELDPGSLGWVYDYSDENGGTPGRVKLDPKDVADELSPLGVDAPKADEPKVPVEMGQPARNTGTWKAPDMSDIMYDPETDSIVPRPKADAPEAPEAPAAWKPKVTDMGPKWKQVTDPDTGRVLFDIEKDEHGVWSVHEPTIAPIAGYHFDSLPKARKWAEKYADLQRDGKELPDENGNFFDDAPAVTPDVTPDVTPEAPAAPKRKPRPNAPLKPRTEKPAEVTPDDVTTPQGPDLYAIRQMSDDALQVELLKPGASEDEARYLAMLEEMDRREQAGILSQLDLTSVDDLLDGAHDVAPRPAHKVPGLVDEYALEDQLMRDNASILDRFFDKDASGALGGLDAISFLPAIDQRKLLRGYGVPANTLQRYMREEDLLAIWGMEPKRMRELGMTHLSIPGATRLDDHLEANHESRIPDPKGLRDREVEDLFDDELDELMDLLSKHSNDEAHMEWVGEEILRRKGLSDDARRREADERNARRASEPTPEPEPEPAPEPVDEPELDVTPEPERAPEPDVTPEPERVDEPTAKDEPTPEPEPERADEPTPDEPKRDDTPETDSPDPEKDEPAKDEPKPADAPADRPADKDAPNPKTLEEAHAHVRDLDDDALDELLAGLKDDDDSLLARAARAERVRRDLLNREERDAEDRRRARMAAKRRDAERRRKTRRDRRRRNRARRRRGRMGRGLLHGMHPNGFGGMPHLPGGLPGGPKGDGAGDSAGDGAGRAAKGGAKKGGAKKPLGATGGRDGSGVRPNGSGPQRDDAATTPREELPNRGLTNGDLPEIEKALEDADRRDPIREDGTLTPASGKDGVDMTPAERAAENAAIDEAYGDPHPAYAAQALDTDPNRPAGVPESVWDRAQGHAGAFRSHGIPVNVIADGDAAEMKVRDPYSGNELTLRVEPGVDGGPDKVGAAMLFRDGAVREVPSAQIPNRIAEMVDAWDRKHDADMAERLRPAEGGSGSGVGGAGTPGGGRGDVFGGTGEAGRTPEGTQGPAGAAGGASGVSGAPDGATRPAAPVSVPDDARWMPTLPEDIMADDVIRHPGTGEPVRVQSSRAMRGGVDPDGRTLTLMADGGAEGPVVDVPGDSVVARLDEAAPAAGTPDAPGRGDAPSVSTGTAPSPRGDAAPGSTDTPASSASAPGADTPSPTGIPAPGDAPGSTGAPARAGETPEAPADGGTGGTLAPIGYSPNGLTAAQEAALLRPGPDGQPGIVAVTTEGGMLLMGRPVANGTGRLVGIDTGSHVEPVRASHIRTVRPVGIVDATGEQGAPDVPSTPRDRTPELDAPNAGEPSEPTTSRTGSAPEVGEPAEAPLDTAGGRGRRGGPDTGRAGSAPDELGDGGEAPEGLVGRRPAGAAAGAAGPEVGAADAIREAARADDGGAGTPDRPDDVPAAGAPDAPGGAEPSSGFGLRAAYVTPDALQIGDYAHVEGVDADGRPASASGFLVDDPQPVTITRPEGTVDMLAVTVSDELDGLGLQTTVYAPLDSMPALAPRPDMADVPEEGWQMDQNRITVRDNLMPERIPADRSGLGLFPGSDVQDEQGRRARVVATRANDVTVVYGADNKPANLAGNNLSVVDGGAARPVGWSADGRRVGADLPDAPARRDVLPAGDPKVLDREVKVETDSLTMDLIREIDKLLQQVQAGNLSQAAAEIELRRRAEAVLDRTSRRRNEAARRIAATHPYRPGLLAQIVMWLGRLAVDVVKAFVAAFAAGWSDKAQGRASADRRRAMQEAARMSAQTGMPIKRIRELMGLSEDAA